MERIRTLYNRLNVFGALLKEKRKLFLGGLSGMGLMRTGKPILSSGIPIRSKTNLRLLVVSFLKIFFGMDRPQ